jgi:hypothetical protein
LRGKDLLGKWGLKKGWEPFLKNAEGYGKRVSYCCYDIYAR